MKDFKVPVKAESGSVMVRKLVQVSDLKKGDTVEVDGKLETVGINYLKRCSFMGWTYKGNPFRDGINRVVFKVPVKGGFRYA